MESQCKFTEIFVGVEIFESSGGYIVAGSKSKGADSDPLLVKISSSTFAEVWRKDGSDFGGGDEF